MPLAPPPPQPPAPPYGLELNTTMQTVATIVLWVGTATLLVYAGKMAREERSIFPVALVVAVAVGSIIEPLYDIAYHLHWLDNGEQWTLFTSFGLPQPVWVMPAYVMVFGLPALLLYRSLSRGATLRQIFTLGALTAVTTAVFEITAINLDLYVYYGESPWRVLDYPLFIAFMEAAQITGFAVLAAVLKLRATKEVHNLALFAIFPCNFAFDVLGAGFPTLILQNSSPDPNGFALFLSAIASVALTATALWWSAQLLLTLQRRDGITPTGTRTPPEKPVHEASLV
ncbi:MULTISPECIES: hypothetical protein [Protofrankia]|uniref:Uncharacterized protein n=1 Tax=Protofrankia coriariae TaxID=1562887 RepID=A0ABR5F074_9ACTN|nr:MULTISPECIES: hypothetical protein [Protofrankia]KLL10117.1 hypothetical protein FrCorBMG51_20060 [Protofrankia coriariae]ONH35227.1 hypothetical protein BL254_12395 [Protofrankia sp. BMG5.30]